MHVPLQKPLHPDYHSLSPYLRKIDATRIYTNRGPLLREYEERLGQLFRCHVAASSSCTMGMAVTWIARKWEDKPVFIPSWTFVATANAVRLAGAWPHFRDAGDASSISVSEFGAPPEINLETKLVDAAAAFDSYASRVFDTMICPTVISTHATKVFSTGEGGFVLSINEDFIKRVRIVLNHGIDERREVQIRGINGKMSEYNAAIGLASLDQWTETRQKWSDTENKYARMLGIEPRNYVTSVYPIRIDRSVVPVMKKLNEAGIETRKMWFDGVHNLPAYKDYPRTSMEKTEKLADTTLFLPFYIDMKDSEMQFIADKLGEIMR